MKIKFEFFIEDDILDVLKTSWKAKEKGDALDFSQDAERLLTNGDKNIYTDFKEYVQKKLEQIYLDSKEAENPNLAEIKKEIITTLYLHGPDTKYNRICLNSILAKLDPALARQVLEKGPEEVYDEFYGEELENE